MSSALYNREILRLAASIPHHRRLVAPDASADKRSPTCGSRVIADVRLDEEGVIAELGLDVSACALGQASAALMAAEATGRTPAEMVQATQCLRAWLADLQGEAEPDFWPGLAVLAPARSYPARHPSILLAFEAVSEAALRAVPGEESRKKSAQA